MKTEEWLIIRAIALTTSSVLSTHIIWRIYRWHILPSNSYEQDDD